MITVKRKQRVPVEFTRTQARVLVTAAHRLLRDKVELPNGPWRRALLGAVSRIHAAQSTGPQL